MKRIAAILAFFIFSFAIAMFSSCPAYAETVSQGKTLGVRAILLVPSIVFQSGKFIVQIKVVNPSNFYPISFHATFRYGGSAWAGDDKLQMTDGTYISKEEKDGNGMKRSWDTKPDFQLQPGQEADLYTYVYSSSIVGKYPRFAWLDFTGYGNNHIDIILRQYAPLEIREFKPL